MFKKFLGSNKKGRNKKKTQKERAKISIYVWLQNKNLNALELLQIF